MGVVPQVPTWLLRGREGHGLTLSQTHPKEAPFGGAVGRMGPRMEAMFQYIVFFVLGARSAGSCRLAPSPMRIGRSDRVLLPVLRYREG